MLFREAAKNNGLFLVARPLRGGGGKGLATKKEDRFSKLKKALVAGPLKKDHSLIQNRHCCCIHALMKSIHFKRK